MTNKQRAPRAGRGAGRPRKQRRRSMPRWLKSSAEVDALARSRCLMVLSVLSGEKPVTEAIQEARISRPTYYQLETRALNAMLLALNPLAPSAQSSSPDLSAAAARIEQLEGQVKHLEQDKRRTQRLLLLTRKSLRWPARRRGRPPKSAVLSSTPNGSSRSRGSKAKTTSPSASTPTRAGESSP
jgi:hypothetical protein